MSKKSTHTARGTCQVCGHIQAIDNSSKIVAKHGYVVAGFGFFKGVCFGAHHQPAELSLEVAHRIIEQLESGAATNEIAADDYRTHKRLCTHYEVYDPTLVVDHGSHKTTGNYKSVLITPETPARIVSDTQEKAAAEYAQHARRARSHVRMMRSHIIPRLGAALYPAKDVIKANRKAAKAKAIEGVRFPTKASRKEVLDRLNRAYDKLLRELQGFYLALPASERTEAKTEVYYSPDQLNNWRAKHAEAARREFPASKAIVDQITALVAEREEIKAAQ